MRSSWVEEEIRRRIAAARECRCDVCLSDDIRDAMRAAIEKCAEVAERAGEEFADTPGEPDEADYYCGKANGAFQIMNRIRALKGRGG